MISAGFPSLLSAGENLVLVPSERVSDLVEEPELDGLRVGAVRLLSAWTKLVEGWPDAFSVSLSRVSGRFWTPHLLYQNGNMTLRVLPSVVSCSQCHVQALGVDPTDPTLYYGAPDGDIALERAWSALSAVLCPECGATLPGHLIWAAPRGFSLRGS